MVTYIKRVYVAGPLTPRGLRKNAKGETENPAIEYLYNVKDMIKAGAELIENGYSPYIPGMDFPLFLASEITAEQIYGLSLDWLEASDAMLLLPYDESCTGVVAELVRAKELDMPVFNSVSDINEYMMRNSNANAGKP